MFLLHIDSKKKGAILFKTRLLEGRVFFFQSRGNKKRFRDLLPFRSGLFFVLY